ncbi:MAG: class I SAM-dependent methyltransferase [Candidatus Bipolaricaulis sp.]|nr:class I SAM-dependent methyltransferase [Candidatus Bipolaricaulis sp.]MDD5645677.1 class I SAM-dependent methyltransferase [Candidatus Bipolaricaulis sp.]
MDASRVRGFYTKQNEWARVSRDPITDAHRRNADLVYQLTSGRIGRVLELGAGGGQNAAAVADLGYSVTAIELVPSVAQNALELATLSRKGRLRVIVGDFYDVELPDRFNVVCYWDGFGVGSDDDQRRLLQHVAGWLAPEGFALIEIYTPWYWSGIARSGMAGRETEFGGVARRYGFDAAGSRMLDTWWPVGREGEAVMQSLRCYSPTDLGLLLEGAGLALETVEPRGAYDPAQDRFIEDAPLGECMQYLAKLVRA